MTTEEAKEYLNRGYRSRERIQAKRERIESWRQIAESITAQLRPDGGVKSSPSKKIENCAVNIVGLQNEIQAEIDELVAVEKEIGASIEMYVLDPTLKSVLEFRYLNYLKWEEIAVRLDITFRWTMTLHKRALELFSAKAL